MNALEKFHEQLDSSDWDARQESEINKALQVVNEELLKAGLDKEQHFAEVERQAFNFSKSPEKRLSFRMAGTQKLDDGSEIPFEWPDINTFQKDDFDYLFDRFKASRNIFAKVEYGLVLFYSKNRQDNDFVTELLKALFDLIRSYVDKAMKDEVGYHIIYARLALSNALHIASNRKETTSIEPIYKSLIEYTFDIHQHWDIKHKTGLRAVIDFSDLAVQYFKDFAKYVGVAKFLDKNQEAGNYLSETYVWGAIYVADISIRLCKKLNTETKEWQQFKAAQYEKLAADAKQRNDIAAVSFIEKAMEIYGGIKDEPGLDRLQHEYQNLRTAFNLGEVRKEMPQDETQRIVELIKQQVSEGSEDDIVKTLLFTPMIRPLEVINKWSDESFQESMLMNLLPTSIQDKFGNTVAQYVTDDERKRFSLLRTYELHLQIAVQTILQYFIEAFRANKISAESVVRVLKLTWMGKNGLRITGGTEVPFSYTRLIESGVKTFFYELEKWKADPSYHPNFVSATDSLVLKAEYLLREFCYFTGIPTFKPNPRQQNIVMEKTLDELLRDLEEKLSEDDHFFIKFVLTEKAGYNLRNQVAHGLLDDIDYGPEYPLLAMIIILKLSNYQFTENNKENV